MPADPGGVFAIHYNASEVDFEIGFCEGWLESGRRILLQKPFTRAWSLNMGHQTFYRGRWRRSLAIPADRHSLAPVPREPWMLITYEDLIAAAVILTECSVPLDPSGSRVFPYRRIAVCIQVRDRLVRRKVRVFLVVKPLCEFAKGG